SPLVRVDALVQLEMAQKRAAISPGTLVSLGWSPWWEVAIVRPGPRSAFRPVPGVDAAMLSITRRSPELLPRERRMAFVRLLARAFASSGRPIRSTLFHGDRRWDRIAARRGIELDATASELDVFDWVAVFVSFTGRGSSPHRREARPGDFVPHRRN